MLRKFISQSVYRSYNLLNSGKLNKFYNHIKYVNDNDIFPTNNEISSFLIKWSFDPLLENNPAMNKIDLKRWIDNVKKKKIYSWAYTGGSYGEPFRIPYSRNRNFIRTATFRYFNEKGGYSLGDSYALIRAKDKNKTIKFLRNETIIVPYDVSFNRLENIIRSLIKKKTTVLLGYPTVIYDLALFLQKNLEFLNLLNIKSIISISEPLELEKKQFIRQIFNCPLFDRYSNEEVGMIAQQINPDHEYIINRFGLIVEVVDPETLNRVQKGEVGKVLVTDLSNELIPIIRYDTGDLAAVYKYENSRLHSIKNIIGRITEQIYSTDNKPVSPLSLGPFIYKPLSKEGQLFSYQFAQISKTNYELRIKTQQNLNSFELSSKLTRKLKFVLGDKAVIKLVFVNDIKPLPSGKRPIFVNEM